jgi:DNA-binding NtrC family response regulator
MAVHSPLNAFSFDISLIEIRQEIKLLEHLKKKKFGSRVSSKVLKISIDILSTTHHKLIRVLRKGIFPSN